MRTIKTDTLTLKALNRATLARQMLLSRERMAPLKAIERLVAMQAQEAKPPFVGLWTRLEKFDRGDLCLLVHSRRVIRTIAMRCTLHLMSSRDFLKFRATLQPALCAAMKSALKNHADELDVKALVKHARAHFGGESRTFETLRDEFDSRKFKGNVRAMAYAVRTHLSLVQMPTDDRWGYPRIANFTVAESWLGASLGIEPDLEELMSRYLAAFGPATAADAQAWSGLKGLSEIFERLRPKLRVIRDERGRELFDLPKAPRPAETIPAPVRFLPDYDNAILSHADRTRIVADSHRKGLVTANLRVPGTFLIDGFVAGTWRVDRSKTAAKLSISPFDGVPVKSRIELAEEGERLLRFMEGDALTFDVRIPSSSKKIARSRR